MSFRWMVVQYLGDVLRLPVSNASDIDKPVGHSTLERDVRRIVVNPFSDNPVTFVPENESAELRELASEIYEDQCDDSDRWRYRERMRDLGIEVDE